MAQNKTNNNLIYPRKSDKDIFLAEGLQEANFNTGFYQVPEIPNSIISRPLGIALWSKRKQYKDKGKYALAFYEYDCFFDGKHGIYNILKYGSRAEINLLIEELSGFAFIICPDYSVYGNFPNYKQIEAMAKSREVGYVLYSYGLKVVINFRASYEWSYELALTGIPNDAIVAIGTLGTLNDSQSRALLRNSIKALINTISLSVMIVYGKAPDDIFAVVKNKGIDIWRFDYPNHYYPKEN